MTVRWGSDDACRRHAPREHPAERCRVDGVVAALGRAGDTAGAAGGSARWPLTLGRLDHDVQLGQREAAGELKTLGNSPSMTRRLAASQARDCQM